MKKIGVLIIKSFLLAVLFTIIVYVTDGMGGFFHKLRDIFVEPALWVLQSGLPMISQDFVIEPGSKYSRASFIISFIFMFWWILSLVIMFVFRKPPNKSLNKDATKVAPIS